MEYLKFDIKLFIFLAITFIGMTVVGTLTHELGHYSVSKLLGYEANISYQSSGHWNNELDEYLNSTYEKYANEIKNRLDFPEKEKYFEAMKKYRTDNFLITLGGPLQTIMIGTFGLIFLLVYRDKFITKDKVYITGWVSIFLALFWLRQVANMFVGLLIYVMKGQSSVSSDEERLAHHLGIHFESIQIITGIIGILVLLVVLRLLPKSIVVTFLISGLVGGIAGYYLWLVRFGQYIMP
jgi:hypothetical protein